MVTVIQFKDNKGKINCNLYLKAEKDIMLNKFDRLGYTVISMKDYTDIVAAQAMRDAIRKG